MLEWTLRKNKRQFSTILQQCLKSGSNVVNNNFLVISMFYCSYIIKHIDIYIVHIYVHCFFPSQSVEGGVYKHCIPSLLLHTGPGLSSTHLAVSSLSQTGRSLRCPMDSRNFCRPTEESDDPWSVKAQFRWQGEKSRRKKIDSNNGRGGKTSLAESGSESKKIYDVLEKIYF